MVYAMSYLALFCLDQAEYRLCQVVILGSSVSEHIDEGVRQGLLQGHPDGCDGHLRAITSTLDVQLTQIRLEQGRVSGHLGRTHI